MSDSYHRDYSRVSKTMLNHFLNSSEDYYHYYVEQDAEPPKPTAPMQIGTAVHAVLLDGDSVEDICIPYADDCYKSNGHLNPKPASQFRADNAEKLVMKPSEYMAVKATCAAVRQHELKSLLTHPDASFEQIITWTCRNSGIRCRAMIDFYIDMGDHIIAYDLKTTDQVYPGPFARTAKRLRYWLQDAHYSTGLETIFNKPVAFKFWCVETTFPHRIAPREYDQRSREIARDARNRAMERLAKCRETDDWKDDWTKNTTTLTLGPWDVDLPEQELEGFDDDEE